MDNTQPTYTLEQVIESMFDFTDYSAEEKESVLAETTSMLTEAALLRGLEQSGESVQNDFNKLLETEPNEDQMMDFIANNIPNFEALIAEEVTIFDQMGSDEKSK
jgi:hypothetical protein